MFETVEYTWTEASYQSRKAVMEMNEVFAWVYDGKVHFSDDGGDVPFGVDYGQAATKLESVRSLLCTERNELYSLEWDAALCRDRIKLIESELKEIRTIHTTKIL